MSEVRELFTRHYRLSPLGPDKVGDDWARWIADPVLMARMNRPVLRLSRADIARHVVALWKSGGMIIAIHARADGAHLGNYELTIDRDNANAAVSPLIDGQRCRLADVLAETDPALLGHLIKLHGTRKAIAQVIETDTPLIAYYEAAGWLKEGVLRQERRAVAGGRRLDVVQFGKLIAAGRHQERA